MIGPASSQWQRGVAEASCRRQMEENKEGEALTTTIPQDQQLEVFQWNKEETLNRIHLMSNENLEWLVDIGTRSRCTTKILKKGREHWMQQ